MLFKKIKYLLLVLAAACSADYSVITGEITEINDTTVVGEIQVD
jgi:hypothetical protein